MITLRRNTLASILLIVLISTSGVCFFFLGSILSSRVVPLEPKGVLWLKPGSIIVSKGLRVVWGAAASPENAPNFWRISLIFKANSSLWVRAYWDDPSNLMFEANGEVLERAFDVRIIDPLVHNRWTWYLENPHSYPVEVSEFVVEYLGIDKPLYRLGGFIIVLGGIFFAVQLPIVALFNISRIEEEID